LAAHHARQRHGLVAGADQHVVGRERALDAVEGRHRLPRPRAAHDDRSATECAAIEQVVRLAEVEHHEVRRVDEQVDRTLSDGEQQHAQPTRRFAG
jgi:hypothetical protein